MSGCGRSSRSREHRSRSSTSASDWPPRFGPTPYLIRKWTACESGLCPRGRQELARDLPIHGGDVGRASLPELELGCFEVGGWDMAAVLVAGFCLLPGWRLGAANVSQVERAARVKPAAGRRVARTWDRATQLDPHGPVRLERGRGGQE